MDNMDLGLAVFPCMLGLAVPVWSRANHWRRREIPTGQALWLRQSNAGLRGSWLEVRPRRSEPCAVIFGEPLPALEQEGDEPFTPVLVGARVAHEIVDGLVARREVSCRIRPLQPVREIAEDFLPPPAVADGCKAHEGVALERGARAREGPQAVFGRCRSHPLCERQERCAPYVLGAGTRLLQEGPQVFIGLAWTSQVAEHGGG